MITSKELRSELRKTIPRREYQRLSDENHPVFDIIDNFLDKLCDKVRMHGLAEEYLTLSDASKLLQAALLKYTLIMEKYGDKSD